VCVQPRDGEGHTSRGNARGYDLPAESTRLEPRGRGESTTLPRVLSPQHSSFLEAGLVATQRLRMAQNHRHGSWSHGVPASWYSVWPHLGIQFGSLELLVFLGDAFSHETWKMDRDYRAKTSGEPFIYITMSWCREGPSSARSCS
jgi:hypothetical protein